MKITLEKIIIAVLILLLFLLNTCKNIQLEKERTKVTQLQLQSQTLDSLLNKNNQVILQQDVIITSSQSSIKSLTDSIFDLTTKQEKKIKDVIAYYKGSTITRIDSVSIPYTDTLAMKQFEDSLIKKCVEFWNFMIDSMITVPRKVEKVSPYYKFSATIKKEAFVLDSLTIPDTLQLRFLTTKGGLFKKKKTLIQFFHSNPLISTTQSNSVIYQPPKKRNLLVKALIFGGGIFLGSKL